jgi:hypothetical protein
MPRHNTLRPLLAALFAQFAAAGIAHAQPVPVPGPTASSVDVQLFQNALGPRPFLTIDSATVPAHKVFALGLMMNYQQSPFSLYNIDRGSLDETTVDVIDKQLTGEIHGAIGLLDRLQIGVAIPVTMFLEGQQFNGFGQATGEDYSGAGLGDIRVEVKGAITQTSFGPEGQDGEFFLAGVLGGTLPTGDDDKFLGDANFTGRARLVGEYRKNDVRLGGMLGLLFREPTTLFGAEVGQQFMYGLAAEYMLHRQVGLLGEWWGRHGFNNYLDEAPMELDVAMRVKVTSMVTLTGGGGVGLIKGIGSPEARGFLGVLFNPDFRDADGDGVYDLDDRCPDTREDRDGFKDDDGCPDLDNDGDGIPDVEDKCPNDAEDLDQFEDEDGCPEEDNDKDGVPDIKDPCPNAAEDGLGKRPADGCPSTTEDSDGDGVVDAKDECPDDPEDRDGFQDYDGCPDLDNDGDGIPDQFDTCPDQAEDPDGFADEDGCPDPDNDQDGVPDAQDKCPTEKETLNGNRDDDGCPDPGAEIVAMGTGKIDVSERITFKGNALAGAGPTVVKLVGMLLKGRPELTVVRIEVSAAEGADAKAEAIKAALVKAGVEAGRLKTAGKQGRNQVDFIVEATRDAADTAPAE